MSLLLVLPLQAYRHEAQVYIDAQARNGLRLWLQSFASLALACPTFEEAPPPHFEPIDDSRVVFTALPPAYRPHTFAATFLGTALILKKLIRESTHLHFAIGGLFGDWGSIAAIIARSQRRKFSVWTDRVESKVLAYQASTKRGLKRHYNFALSKLTEKYERRIIQISDLGLFHGMDCFEAYSPYCKKPRVVHDIHLSSDDMISTDEIALRLQRGGPLRIVYAGRVHRDKGVDDWFEALRYADQKGFDFQATWFGNGPDLERMRSIVARSELDHRIVFAGPTKDHREMIGYLRKADVFLFCHKTPESPRCLIEALMCGLPIVGYSSPYPNDLTKGSRGGILTPAHDPLALGNALLEITHEALPALSERAKQDGRAFDSESVFRHRSNLMKELLQ